MGEVVGSKAAKLSAECTTEEENDEILKLANFLGIEDLLGRTLFSPMFDWKIYFKLSAKTAMLPVSGDKLPTAGIQQPETICLFCPDLFLEVIPQIIAP